MKFIFVYITNPSGKEAKRISEMLLDRNLIACANIHPIDSVYKWEGKTVHEKEFVLVAKTSEKNFSGVVAAVEAVHPYKIPCITKVPVTPNKKYAGWMESGLK